MEGGGEKELMLSLIKWIKVHQAVSWKTALSNKNIANNLFLSFLSIQFWMLLHKVMEFGNGNFLIAVRKKEEQAEKALYFFLFF